MPQPRYQKVLKIGVIADDFTGATDIASFLVKNGLSTIQLTAVDDTLSCPEVEAIVISGKTRSCPVDEAIADSLKACRWLKKNGCRQIYFKYCSTFDSTDKGNIGPVTDALMKELGVDFTVLSPALPVNKRTVYLGYLFAGDTLLEESGMRNHPITPMKDSLIKRLMEPQAQGKCGIIDHNTLNEGSKAIEDRIAALKAEGCRYASVDAIDERDLLIQGKAFRDFPLVTGGSGLAIGLARAVKEPDSRAEDAQQKGYPQGKKAVVFSGSCSVMTNKQVAKYRAIAASKHVEIAKVMESESSRAAFIAECVDFVKEHTGDSYAPLLFASADPDTLHQVQEKYGAAASAHAVEQFFASMARALKAEGYERFIVAGGETSGIVTQSLEVKGFYIGPSVAPGVPWVRSINSPISLTLKSGNFGDEDFFEKTQRDYPV